MISRRHGRLAPLVLLMATALGGCSAQPQPHAVPIVTASPTATDATPEPADAPVQTDPTESTFATPDYGAPIPAGVEIDPVTLAWVYSDKVAFADLPIDGNEDVVAEPIDSLPDLPSIPSLEGQKLANDEGMVDVWDLQQYYIAQCMAEQGFEWRWAYYSTDFPGGLPVEFGTQSGHIPNRVKGYILPGSWDDQTPGFQEALWGENSIGGDPNYEYSWDTAGCHGYAVHVTGQDDAH